MCGKFQGLPSNGVSLVLERRCGPFVKTGCCQTSQIGRFWKFFGQNYLKFNLSRSHSYKKIEISSNRDHWTVAVFRENWCLPEWADVKQSHRVTDTQRYSDYKWVKFFVPDCNKLPYLLCSQGDKFYFYKIQESPKNLKSECLFGVNKFNLGSVNLPESQGVPSLITSSDNVY